MWVNWNLVSPEASQPPGMQRIDMLTESEREEIKIYLEGVVLGKMRDRVIRAIEVNSRYRHQPKMRIEVGKSYRDLEPGAPYEEVVAIFESESFLVCTKERGAGTGLPYYFVREDVRRVET
ncbi:MAG: hypothetical protein ABIK83_16025 [Candidatus Zixiibacteriota bacterium]